MPKDKKALIEAALFMSENPLTIRELGKIANVSSKSEIKQILEELKKDLENSSRGITLALTGEGYQFQVKTKFANKVSNLTPYSDLNPGSLRALGIIALNQPITQADIVKIQGNKVYNYIKKLEKRGLIRTEKQGRTKILATTREFENYFGSNLHNIQQELKDGINVRNQESGTIELDETIETVN